MLEVVNAADMLEWTGEVIFLAGVDGVLNVNFVALVYPDQTFQDV